MDANNRSGAGSFARRLVVRTVLSLAVVLAGVGLLPGPTFRTEEVFRTDLADIALTPAADLARRRPQLAAAAAVVQTPEARLRREGGASGAADRNQPGSAVPVSYTEAAAAEPSGPEPPADALPEPPEERAAEALEDERLLGGRLAAEEFAAIGVTFEREPEGPVFVRVHDQLGWSDWYELTADAGEGPDPGTEGNGKVSTPPIWTGSADGYMVSLPSGAESAQPEVATVHRDTRTVVVDGVEDAGAAEYPVPGAIPAQPRSAWGARAPRDGIGTASSIRYAVVHHTVNSNSYAAADVPGILRSIQAYHMDGNGWSDIGYNFLVDRFGRIWEGRAGSIGSAAVGAHVAGFNTGSVGIANIGTYDSAGPSAAQVTATAEIAAWRLAAYGVDASSLVNVTAGSGADKYAPGTTITIPRVVGHRDVGASACPGTQLWNHLGSIRNAVAARTRELSAPFGNLELLAPSPGQFRMAGWAADPQTSGPVVVYAEVGPYRFSTLASLQRPDIGAAFPALGPNHGFDATFGVPPGRYRSCIYAIDPQNGSGTALFCGDIVTGGAPMGQLTGASVSGGVLTVDGWAVDPDTTAPIPVLVDAGGRLQMVLADRRRWELAPFFPVYGPDHGFVAQAFLPPGATRVCAYAMNVGPGSDTGIGCSTVVVK